MKISQANDEDNEPTHHEESWTVATSSKKFKVTPFASGRKIETLEKKNNGFRISNCIIHSAHCQKRQPRTQRKVRQTAPKPPPIYIDAKIIDPLIELLNNTAGKDNYVIKQIKIDQVKV